jgi:prepilin peptidase CpaA
VFLASLAIRIATVAALLWLAAFDVRTRRLPTHVVLAIGLLFFIDAVVIRMPIVVMLAHVGLALAVFLICAVLFFAKMLGGGDAKLAAVIFLWVGLPLALPTLTLISVVGTLVAVLSYATRKMSSEQKHSWKRLLALFSCSRGVPYGVALAIGGGFLIIATASPVVLTR